ncbi:MAG: helix-turn-helix domain-containing protein, partial [Clostridiales bacterium]|nr:helix-turn-helix domain-containing protein [Clostridiales bacterium]
YNYYEQARHEPSLETLKRICDFFDVSADYLIGRTDNY